MIPLGATVRWKDAIYKSAWSAVVTGHPRPKMVEVNGRSTISEGLLEVTEMGMTGPEMQELADLEYNLHLVAEERDGLTEIVAQQCELIASMTADASEFRRLQAVEEDFDRLRDAVSDALLALTGTRRPSARDAGISEILALAQELERTELPSGG